MSLLVWLPMTKDLTQQGLSDLTVSNNGATLSDSGKLGKCYSFDGSDDYINLGSSIGSYFDTSPISFAFWIKSLENGTRGVIFGSYGSSSETNYFNIEVNSGSHSDNALRFCWKGLETYSSAGMVTYNAWVHIAVVWDGTKVSFYKNGKLLNSNALSPTSIPTGNTYYIGRDGRTGGTAFYGCLNDFRFYDHALSAKEVELLSRGLVCHYPLCDNSIQVSNVSNTSTTFNTSNADGGWSHWGQSGHKGSCGQTTSSTYIYTSGQSYAHRVTNNSGATGNYLMFQSPSFSATGGYRSMCAIIKEVNGNKITNDVCFPVWNGGVGTKEYVWDTISPLGNGFYLCKVESFQQDGTNNLVGIYVKPGKEIYVTNCYIENDRQACSDFIFGTSTAVYDCSGFQNNMTASGTVSCNVDSARYSKSTHFINGSYLMATQNSPTYLPTDGLTVNIWVKPTTWGTPISCTEGGGWNIELSTNGLQFQCYISSVGYKGAASTVKASDLIDGKWHMLTGTFDRIAQQTKFYIDGELKGTNSTGSSNGVGYANNRLIISGEAQTTTPTSSTFVGEESDVRIYATALSATQVAELYNTAVSVANNGALLGYELVEV